MSLVRFGYRYSPLQRDEIRLLKIVWSGLTWYSAEYSIIHVRVDDAPKYIAVSYVWGDPTDLDELYIGPHDEVLPVTSSCRSILERITVRNKKCYVWIDAVCINQNDLRERWQQVRMMGDIYCWASEVIVDLGEKDRISNYAIKYIRKRSEYMHNNGGTPDHSVRNSLNWVFPALAVGSIAFGVEDTSSILNPVPGNNEEPLLSIASSDGIKRLIQRPWFTRLWVLQEVYSSSKAIVMCGEDSVSWNSFKAVVRHHLAESRWSRLAHLPFALIVEKREWSFGEDLLPLLHMARYCECTDSRDKYFALLSMLGADDKFLNDIGVSYFNNTGEVFTKIAIHLVEQRGLDILVYKEGWSKLRNLPSWAPDWSIKPENTALSRKIFERVLKGKRDTDIDVVGQLYGAGGEFDFTPAAITRKPGSGTLILICFGLVVGKIVSLSHAFDTVQSQYEATQRCLETWKKEIRAMPRLRSCLRGQDNGDILSQLFQESLVDDHFEGKRSHKQKKIDTKLNVHNRRIAFTDNRLMGLVPAEVMPGDLLCVILDCPMPVILRPASPGSFWHVGCGIVDGLMYGEALSGIERAYPHFRRRPLGRHWHPPPGVHSFLIQ